MRYAAVRFGVVLVALFVTLIPTPSARCCRRSALPAWTAWCAFNVLAMSGAPVEAAGDVDTAAD